MFGAWEGLEPLGARSLPPVLLTVKKVDFVVVVTPTNTILYSSYKNRELGYYRQKLSHELPGR